MNKYRYLYIIQGNYGYGWEDVDEVEKSGSYDIPNSSYRSPLSYAHYLLREYRMIQGSYRMINRRELNKVQ